MDWGSRWEEFLVAGRSYLLRWGCSKYWLEEFILDLTQLKKGLKRRARNGGRQSGDWLKDHTSLRAAMGEIGSGEF